MREHKNQTKHLPKKQRSYIEYIDLTYQTYNEYTNCET